MNTPPEDPSQSPYLRASDCGNSSPSQGSLRNSRTCLVCGAPASVKNFGILTCESCKAFFRRNAPRGVDAYECTYSGDCEITVVTRKFCQKCRLVKCFSVGMDSTKIESVEKKMKRKEKLVETKWLREQQITQKFKMESKKSLNEQKFVRVTTTENGDELCLVMNNGREVIPHDTNAETILGMVDPLHLPQVSKIIENYLIRKSKLSRCRLLQMADRYKMDDLMDFLILGMKTVGDIAAVKNSLHYQMYSENLKRTIFIRWSEVL